MTKTILAIVGGSLLLAFCGVVVSAEPADPTAESLRAASPAMLPESFTARGNPLESLIEANGAWGLGASSAELQKMELNLQLRPGLTISHNMHSALVDAPGALMRTGLSQDVTDSIGLALGARTTLTASRQLATVEDLTQRLISGSETRKLGLTQGFGQGTSTGLLSLEQAWTTQLTGESATRLSSRTMGLTTTTEKFSLTGNLHALDSLSAGTALLRDQIWTLDFPSFFDQKGHFDTQRLYDDQTASPRRLAVDNFVLPLGFIEKKGLIEYHLREEKVGGVTTRARFAQVSTPLPLANYQATTLYSIKDDITAAGQTWQRLFTVFVPVKMFDDTTRLDWKASTTSVKGVWTRERLLALTMPLTSWKPGAYFSQSYQRLASGGPAGTVLTSIFGVPWKGFGTTGDFKQQYITTENDNSFQSRLITDLGIMVNKERLSLQRDFARTRSGSAYQEREMLALTTPRFDLFTPKATFALGRIQVNEEPGVDSGKTTVDLSAQPTEKITVAARMEQSTQDPGVDVETEQAMVSAALSKYVTLQGRINSMDQSDLPTARVVRAVQLRSEKPSPSGMGLLVGYANWDAPGASRVEGNDVQLAVGDPTKGVGVVAQVSGYDSGNLTAFQDPLVKISVSHGQPAGLSVRLDYNDQQGRPAAERSYAVGVPALGGTLQVGYVQNPLNRFGNAALLGDRYDAALQSRIGTVDVKFNYRYYYFDQPLFSDSAVGYYHLQLAGGQEDRGGKLALGYSMGDFVPQPNPNTPVPSSILDLSYSKRWTDNGRFVISLQSNTPPANSPTLQRSIQGRLEYSTSF